MVLPSNTAVPYPVLWEYLGSFTNTLRKPGNELSGAELNGASLTRLQLQEYSPVPGTGKQHRKGVTTPPDAVRIPEQNTESHTSHPMGV